MIARGLAIAVALAACGDNVYVPDLFAAVSGSRLALQKYRYDDGTEQTATTEFFDTGLHTRCTAQRWTDGTTRCLPVADDAQYADPACTTAIGIARTIPRPSFFIGYDVQASVAVPVRLFRAAGQAAAITAYYSLVNGACSGPIQVAMGQMSFFEVGAELDAFDLVELRDDRELGDGRLGLRVRTSDDGLRIPFGLRDRELDLACTPRPQADGGIACEPAGAITASFYGDAQCHEPVAAVASTVAPRIARLVEPSGCASYHTMGRAVAPPVYRRDGDTCTAATAPAETGLFAVAGPVALPGLERSLAEATGHRLSRVVLDHDGLRFVDDRLFDTALGTDCLPRNLRNEIRCLPTTTIPAINLFADGCTTPVPVVEVAPATCEPLRYATTARPFQLRTIGDPVTTALFRLDGMTCTAYTPAPGMVLRSLGAPVDVTTFMRAVYFGERML